VGLEKSNLSKALKVRVQNGGENAEVKFAGRCAKIESRKDVLKIGSSVPARPFPQPLFRSF